VIGASFIDAGKFIQGRPKAKAKVDACAPSSA
jgi:hypothetical protein